MCSIRAVTLVISDTFLLTYLAISVIFVGVATVMTKDRLQ